MNEREQLLVEDTPPPDDHTRIILAVEEPELYIHPQLAKLFYDVLKEFAKSDQVVYATHSPLLIDAFEYQNIVIVNKLSPEVGTKVSACHTDVFKNMDDRKIFKGLTRLNPTVNEMFFAKQVLIVEGPEDEIAVTAYLLNEGKIKNRVEELDWSIIVSGGKDAIPFYQRILKAFSIKYTVLHDLDIDDNLPPNELTLKIKKNDEIKRLAGRNHVVTFPVNLEASLGIDGHLKDQYKANEFFMNPENMTQKFRAIIKSIFDNPSNSG
jgi:predicted ATP-dependent endonuclease of OLD family